MTHAWYSSLSRAEKALATLDIAQRLIVAAREPERTRDDLRALNELQHRLLDQARKLLLDDPDRYDDAALLDLIGACVADLGLSPNWALERRQPVAPVPAA